MAAFRIRAMRVFADIVCSSEELFSYLDICKQMFQLQDFITVFLQLEMSFLSNSIRCFLDCQPELWPMGVDSNGRIVSLARGG